MEAPFLWYFEVGLKFFAPEEEEVVVDVWFALEEEPRFDPVVLWVETEACPVVEVVAASELCAIVGALEVVYEELDDTSSVFPSLASLRRLSAKVFFWLILVSSP